MDFVTAPSVFATYGSSYLYRTEIAFRFFVQSSFQMPADVNVLFDGAGHWHGSNRALNQSSTYDDYFDAIKKMRYNCLYGDFHAKSITYDQLQTAWAVDL